MANERTPTAIREGVRAGILDTIKRDVELRGGRTARLLGAAGILGVTGALSITFLVSTHPFGHHPPWHVTVFSTVWAGLLFVSFAIAFLQLRTPSEPLASYSAVGILGLGLAGICGAACPNPHFFDWWSASGIGAPLAQTCGLACCAGCFGLVTSLAFGLVSAIIVLSGTRHPVAPLIPAAVLFALLTPGVALQSVDGSFGVAAGWLIGTAVGAYLGVSGGIRVQKAFNKT